MKKVLFLLFFVLAVGNVSLLAQAIETKDPFVPLLPEEKHSKKKESAYENNMALNIPREELSVNLEGVIWGRNIIPQAIIDGEIYKAGDKIKGTDAVVKEIKENKVSVFFDGRIIILKTK